ncbi:MAG: sigma-70 family RNA polymerase sigma factor [Phaeodactylibacter sp.]|uniref:RNA polymerase sigma factor n=1 Tax=Phaeodactylibacter sp. TaxID=1940289 RepID=UPI0032EFB1BF
MKKSANAINWTWYTALKHSDPRAANYLVDHIRPVVIGKLKRSGAGEADAEDVFMEAAEDIFRRVRKTEQAFFEDEKFPAYFLQACVWTWFKKSGNKKAWLEVTNHLSEVLFSEQDIEEELIAAERSKLFWATFDKLGAACQKVLRLFIVEERPHQDIADEMGYQYQYAKKKKYKCYQKLVEMIKLDPLYKELTDNSENGNT